MRPGSVLLVALALLASACAGRSDERPELVVSAAASLTDGFADVALAFEEGNEMEVTLNLGPSSTLREQVLSGAPVDVFAPASPGDMARVVEAGLVRGTPQVFARNPLTLVVPKGNPGRVEGLADLGRRELLVGLCSPGVPCGDLAREVLDSAGVVPAVDSEEPDVRALLTKVSSGELDVGIVYRSDFTAAAGSVEAIEIPDAHNREAVYPIAVVSSGANPDSAATFTSFVLSEEAQSLLRRHGFAAP